MVKIFTALFFILSMLQAQNLFIENFSYGTRDSLDGIGEWQIAGGNSASNIRIVAPGLSFPGYPGSGIGNAIHLSNTGNGDGCLRSFAKRDSGSVYLSYLMRVDSLTATATQGYNITLDQWGGSTNICLKSQIQRVNNTTFKMGIEKYQGLVFAPKTFTINTTYLIVLKYTFVPGGAANDSAKIFVFSGGTPSVEPAKPDTFTVTGADNIDLGDIYIMNAFSQTGLKGSSVKIDGIKIGTAWENSVLQATPLYFNEDFNFNAGDSLRGKNGWQITFGGTPMLISASGLSYPGYAGSLIGKALTITGGAGSQTPIRSFTHPGTGSIYYSFLANVTGTDASEGYFTELANDGGGSYRAVVYAKVTAGKVYFGARPTMVGSIVFDSTQYTSGKTYLLILKYKMIDSLNNDEVSLYVFENGIPAQEPTKPKVGPLVMPNDVITIGSVGFNSGIIGPGPALSGATIMIDGLRVSNAWYNGVTTIKNSAYRPTPEGFTLSQNYPNPFNPSTSIGYRTSTSGHTVLKVFDLLGKEVMTLVNEQQPAGAYSVRLNGAHLSSGCYFYTLSSGGRAMTKKLLLMK